ncbi:helix-turn-helix domain-containing protein [Pseudomonas aeruginosa]|uniref:helix-turn-helix domain-containing protein n=1 Tax=Pseudomonas aeruginosa TaxID=287 RepID=UPI00068C2070|nr:helix-turn-helix domain-containing protein [Pseudomonas aeruginosa]MBG4707846.1 helix-turn-helix domain-containing protein [Pseudomonas aeruginosa]MBI8516370.1 helix-turn-helix domain-containing protein [Pseudomonas aeruginosa]MBI8533898.1 helix-turn-helix domain-containing protein [Pseudomonas aeruginosa]MCO3336213.1 winged helix-turn-helix transcriptional regulator [Pseudomonas aeruginosa]NRS77063.1 helix-turn-helix domain-containing protein [Pseudomonas aeruginosa]
MTGKQASPDQGAQAVILREAGYTLSAIAERLGLSLSTVQRLLKKHKAVAGATTHALIEKARDEMLASAFSLESIQQTAASLVLDDLAIAQQIRRKLANALDVLESDSPIVFRSLAASATTLKLTQDVGRRALPLDKLEQAQAVEELPELQIHVMTPWDVEEMRAEQRLDEAELRGDAEGVNEELENLQWIAQKKAPRYESDDIVVIE